MSEKNTWPEIGGIGEIRILMLYTLMDLISQPSCQVSEFGRTNSEVFSTSALLWPKGFARGKELCLHTCHFCRLPWHWLWNWACQIWRGPWNIWEHVSPECYKSIRTGSCKAHSCKLESHSFSSNVGHYWVWCERFSVLPLYRVFYDDCWELADRQ